MRPITTTALANSLRDVLAPTDEFRARLAQDAFSGTNPEQPSWAIGPFQRDDRLTFRPEGQWHDPTDIGWESTAIFNPSLIEQDGELVLFYRSSPRMESTASRIGMARLGRDGTWRDAPENPVIYPTQDNEVLGCEDPKIYRADGHYFLYYNGIFPIDPVDVANLPTHNDLMQDVGCDINLAISDDLRTWTKVGRVVPHSVSRLWAKGAVIPRLANGDAARIGGRFLMFLSEGCGGNPQIGLSTDMVNWTFERHDYLDMSRLGGHLHEVACAVVPDSTDDQFLLDFYYANADGLPSAAQARYSAAHGIRQDGLSRGGTLAWGGLLHHDGTWLFSQGWDAEPGVRELFFYRGAIR